MSRRDIRFLAVIAAVLLSLVSDATADPALWRVSDADSDIYIFGTVHILPPALEWRNREIDQAFSASDTVWFEAPATDPSAQGETLVLIQQYGLNPSGNPLSAQISDDAREKLNAVMATTGIPAMILEPMRPWLASVTISVAYIQSQGYRPESGVESVLWPEAHAGNKTLEYFETLDEQVRFFADLPPEVEAAYFEQTLRDFDGAADELDRLVAAWEAGDIPAIDDVMNAEVREASPELYEILIVERNRRWASTIAEVLDGSGTHFVAVGAGHLAGPEGVVELLRSNGIEVEGP